MKEKPTPEDFSNFCGHLYNEDDPRFGMEVEVNFGKDEWRDGVVYGETDVITNFHGTNIGGGFYIGYVDNLTIPPTLCGFSIKKTRKKILKGGENYE